jgi:cytoskeleton-associated protein 5
VAALCQIPGWGDSNFQVLLNVFEIFGDLIESKAKISIENVKFITTGCVEKIADAKLNATICELMDAFTNLTGVELVLMKVLKKSASHKNPKVLLESLEWALTTLTKEAASKQVDPKALIESVKANLGNSNPSIRLAATNILATVIAYRGMENKAHLGEVKPTVMAKIDSTISDLRDKGIVPVSPTKTPKKRNIPKKESEEDSNSPPKAEEPSLQLPGGLLGKLSDSNWKVRRGALEELLEIVQSNQDVVKANINDLISSLRQRLHDANKNLIVLTLEILRHISNSFGKQWERYSKMIMKEVLKVLCDSKKTVREAGVLTLHSWSDKLSLKTMQTHFISFVSDSKTNVDGKVSILIFMTELLDGSALPFDHCLPETLAVISDCLLGKALNLRETSSSLLRNLAEAFEVDKMKDSMTNMDKQHAECIVTCLTKLGYITKASNKSERRPKSALSSTRPVQSRQSRPATAGAKLTPKLKAVKRAKEPEPDSFTPNDNKAERARKAPKKSLAKLEDLQRPENVRNHEMILSQYATENLCDHLFHSDFKKHCVAVEIISSLVAKAETFQGVLDNLDLILTWFSYRICEGNMQVLVKILNASGSLVTKLKEKLYKLTDYEAGIIIPCLVEKCGHNNDRIRQSYRDLLIKFPHIYNSKASIMMLVQGLFSKNYRTKVVCLEALEVLYEQHGSDFYNTKVLKEIAVLISERDAALKNKALSLMAHIYRDIGSQCWKYLSSIPENVRKSLDMKFKSLEAPSGQTAARNSNAKTPNSVQRPTSARKKLRSPILPDRGLTTPPASTALDKKAEEATSLWNRSLTRASSQDTAESIEGMKQLCHILLDYAKNASGLDLTTMVNSADKLVCNLSEKVSFIFGKAIEALNSSSTRTAEAGSSRGCKYVLNTLMHSFQLTPRAASVSEPTLRKIMKNLLVLLLDEAIPSLEEGGQLLKALNVLMLKILENGNRTSTFLSLLWLLGEGACSVEELMCSKFSDLIIKCLIKQTKHLSASIESVNLEGILAGIHTFLCGLDSGSIRNRLMEDDKPLRMVKTILHELCKLKGTDIYKSLLNIPRSQDKKQLIYTYVDLYVHTTTAARPKPTSRDEQAVDVKVSTPNASSVKPGTKSLAEIKAELAQIFRKIGEKDTSKEGLEELFFFQKSMPHIDIETHLSKTSEGFQEYIRNGLKQVSSRDSTEKGKKKSPLAESDKNKISPPKKKALPSIEELKQRVEKAKALLNETTC